jgi:hypothetical protein
MKKDLLTDVLAKQVGAKKDGTTWNVPDGAELTLFVALEGETLTVPRVSRLELHDAMIIADGPKGERYVVAAEDVRALRVDRGPGVRRDRGAGFGRAT